MKIFILSAVCNFVAYSIGFAVGRYAERKYQRAMRCRVRRSTEKFCDCGAFGSPSGPCWQCGKQRHK